MALFHSLCSRHTPGRLLLHSLDESQEQQDVEQLRPRAWLGQRPALTAAAPCADRATTCPASAAGSPGSPGSGSEEPSSSGHGGNSQPGPAAPPSSGGSPGGQPDGGSGSSQPSSAGPLSGLVAALQDASRMVGEPAFADVPVPTIYLGGLPAPIPAGEQGLV